MKPATSNLASRWGLQRPTQKKRGCGPGLGKLPKILRFPFDISATAEASDFKFGVQLRFAKAHHKLTPRGKVSVGLG